MALQTSCTDVGGSGDPSLLSVSAALASAITRGSQGTRSAATPASAHRVVSSHGASQGSRHKRDGDMTPKRCFL